MSVSRRQFFALVGAGAAATLLPLELTHAEAEPVPKVTVDGVRARAFRVVEVRIECLGPDSSIRTHVEAVQTDGYMSIAFDMASELSLRPSDIVYIDMEKLYGSWPPPIESNRGDCIRGIQELTLTMPPLAEREAMDAWRDER